MEEKLLRGSEVANVLNVCQSFAYQLMREGKIPVVRMGRAVRVRESDLALFIYQNTSPSCLEQADSHGDRINLATQ